MKTQLGSNLIFISQILRDGSGVKEVPEKYQAFMQDDQFRISRLSITEDTYIAFNMNVFVVKLKNK